MTLVLVGCLSLARVIPPPPNRGAQMHLNGFEDLEQLVSSENITDFIESVDRVACVSGAREDFASFHLQKSSRSSSEEICNIEMQKCVPRVSLV